MTDTGPTTWQLVRGLRRGRLPDQGTAPQRHDLLSQLLAPLVSVAILATLFLLATGPSHASGAASPGGTADGTSSPPATSAAASGGAAPDRPGTTPISFTGPVDPEPTELRAYYGKRVAWAVVPRRRGLRLRDRRGPGRLQETERREDDDRAAPAGQPPARTPRIGSLFINPGGPGGSGNRLRQDAPSFFDDACARALTTSSLRPAGDGGVRSGPMLPPTPTSTRCMPPTPRRTRPPNGPPAASPCGAQPALPRQGRRPRGTDGHGVRRPRPRRPAVQPWRTSGSTTTASATHDDRRRLTPTSSPAEWASWSLDSAVLPDALAEETPTSRTSMPARGSADDFDNVVTDFVTDCGSSITCPLGADTPAVSPHPRRVSRPPSTGSRSRRVRPACPA